MLVFNEGKTNSTGQWFVILLLAGVREGWAELIPAGMSWWLYLHGRRAPAKLPQAKATKTSII